jgi:sec-independent protein translocase protein TatB
VFDIGFWELVLIGVVALVVLGPERLPTAARTAGLLLGKLRRTVTDVKAEIERELHMDELQRASREHSAKMRQAVSELRDEVLQGDKAPGAAAHSPAPELAKPESTQQDP